MASIVTLDRDAPIAWGAVAVVHKSLQSVIDAHDARVEWALRPLEGGWLREVDLRLASGRPAYLEERQVCAGEFTIYLVSHRDIFFCKEDYDEVLQFLGLSDEAVTLLSGQVRWRKKKGGQTSSQRMTSPVAAAADAGVSPEAAGSVPARAEANPIGEIVSQHLLSLSEFAVPVAGMRATQRVRVSAGSLQLDGSRLSFCDAWSLPTGGVSVKVPPGSYVLSVEIQSYVSDSRIATLTVQLEDSRAIRHQIEGLLAVDVALAAVFDGDRIESFARERPKEWAEWLESFIGLPWQTAGCHPCEAAGADVFYVATGFGDGVYPVYSLVENGRVVGAEAVFLPPDQVYPG